MAALELRDHLRQDAGVAGDDATLVPAARPSRSFESSPSPSALIPPPMRSAETWASPGALASICAVVSGARLEAELRHEPERAHEPERVVVEARRAETVRSSRRSRSPTPPKGSSRSPPSSRIAIALIVKSRRAMSSASSIAASLDDREVAMSRPCRPLGAGRRQLDARRDECPNGPIAREEPHADELAVNLHVLDAPVWLEQRAETRLVDAGNEEVLVGVREAEKLVAHRAADDVRVDPERADVGADRVGTGGFGRRCGELAPYRCATASISTSAPEGSSATSNVERAGGRSPTQLA